MSRRLALPAVAILLLLTAPTARAQGDGDRVLFNTLLADLQGSGRTRLDSLPPEVRARALRFQERARRFRSALPALPVEPGPERSLEEKRRELERGLVALIDRNGIEALARDYARRAILGYEWEGMSDGPLGEAGFAEEFLARNPGTPLEPYLELFLAHRYRCIGETLAPGESAEARDQAAAQYRRHLAIALADADPLVRFTATDMAARPFLYLPPATQRDSAPVPCSDTALAEPIADPHAWALTCFGASEGSAAAQPGTLTEFALDLDGDGAPELFIGSKVARGNAGGTHFVFRREGPSYRYLGSLFLHPDAIKVLAPGGDGSPTLAVYLHLGAGEGSLETVRHDGRAFIIERRERIVPEGPGLQRLVELFGPAFASPEPSVPGAPAIGVEKALALAREFVEEQKVDLSAQHIQSVALRSDNTSPHPGLYWHVQWAWNRPALGGEYGLRVYLDGTITVARLGP
jgi:hypothetical protein